MNQRKSSPLVTIVICTFNGDKYLAEQLASLENQSYPHIEFICSDNNSTDSTKQILRSWCNHSANRFFFVCEERGLNKNFYSAIAKASGEYILFCDQDDIWLKEKVEKLVNFHEQNPMASLVYCLSKEFSGSFPSGNFKLKQGNYLEGTDIRKTMLISFTLGHNICIKKELLLQMEASPDEIVAYDWWITVSAMCVGPIRCLPEILTYWRKHPANTTKKINEGLFYENRIFYLQRFEKNKLINSNQRKWIEDAINCFSRLKENRFSLKLFAFLMSYADIIFWYKIKKKLPLKWISYLKWSFIISHRTYKET